MWRDALRTVAIAVRRFVLGAVLLSGAALTMRVAWFGLCLRPECISGFCEHRVSNARMRVKAAQDAAIQFMIEQTSCPRGIDDLVAGRFLERGNAKDPWGSRILIICPSRGGCDGLCADALSLGPDKELGTADDIKSWAM